MDWSFCFWRRSCFGLHSRRRHRARLGDWSQVFSRVHFFDILLIIPIYQHRCLFSPPQDDRHALLKELVTAKKEISKLKADASTAQERLAALERDGAAAKDSAQTEKDRQKQAARDKAVDRQNKQYGVVWWSWWRWTTNGDGRPATA